MKTKKLYATEIEYDVTKEELELHFDTQEEFEKALSDINHNIIDVSSIIGINNYLELPPELYDADDSSITEYISDTTGYFIRSFLLQWQ